MSVFVARADEKQEARPGCCDVDAPCSGATIADVYSLRVSRPGPTCCRVCQNS